MCSQVVAITDGEHTLDEGDLGVWAAGCCHLSLVVFFGWLLGWLVG